jgi:hypothetical protein
MPPVYLALLIPLIVTGIFYYFKRREFVWWEFFIPIASVLVAILISKAIIDHARVQFNELWGSTVTAIYEQEPYNYWQHQTCSYTTTDSKGNSTTHYYDCSHQVDEGPAWYAVTDLKEQFGITEKMHDELVKQFKTNRTIVNSHTNYSPRDRASGSRGTKFEGKRVGQTSYEYKTIWNGDDNTRKAYVSQHSYENKIKASDLSIFNIKIVKKAQADSMKLFEYPRYNGKGLFRLTDGLNYPTIVGDSTISKETQEKFKRLNGKFGPSNQLRLWILIFENKPEMIAEYQENYWVKGNMNELVLCIGKRGKEIQWSHAFSWAKSDILTSAVKDEVMNLYTYKDSTIKKTQPKILPVGKKLQKKILDKVGQKLPANIMPLPNQATTDTIIKIKSSTPQLTEQTWDDLYTYLNQNLNKFQRRSFKEFDYLTVEPSTGAVIFIYLLALIISIAMNFWVTTNDIY